VEKSANIFFSDQCVTWKCPHLLFSESSKELPWFRKIN